MDIQRAFDAARAWRHAGPLCGLGVFWDRGMILDESHRAILIAEVQHEQQWCESAIRAKEKDRRGNVYGAEDREDLANLMAVVESMEVGVELMPAYNHIPDDQVEQIRHQWLVSPLPPPTEDEYAEEFPTTLEELGEKPTCCEGCAANWEEKRARIEAQTNQLLAAQKLVKKAKVIMPQSISIGRLLVDSFVKQVMEKKEK